MRMFIGGVVVLEEETKEVLCARFGAVLRQRGGIGHKGIEKPSEGRYNGFLTALYLGWSVILLTSAE